MRILILFFFVLGAVCHADIRTWTAVNGKEVEAEFVSNEKGIVKLKLKSGKVFEVPLNKLSIGDQEFLKNKSPSKETIDEEAQFKFLPLISDADVERFAKGAIDYNSADTTDYTGWTKDVYEDRLVELVHFAPEEHAAQPAREADERGEHQRARVLKGAVDLLHGEQHVGHEQEERLCKGRTEESARHKTALQRRKKGSSREEREIYGGTR